MKFSTWWLYCLVISVSATTVCMEQVAPLPTENLVALLPKLTVLDPTYRSLGSFEPSFGYANKQQSYQQAFSYLNKEDALACLAIPQIFSRQVILDGKSIERISKHTFPLANFAQGLLFLQQGKAVRAQLEFNLAKDRVGYKSHEAPVQDAALATLALTNNNHVEAFSHIKKLVHTPYNPVWQEFGLEQMCLLAAQGYLPAKDAIKAHDALKEKTKEDASRMLQLLVQPEHKNFADCPLLQGKKMLRQLCTLSEGGNCAASNLLARVAFEKAVEGKNLYGKKIDKRQALQEVKPFAWQASAWQEQKPYHVALTQFLDGAIACEKREWSIASESLVALVQQKTDTSEIKALQKKAVELLDMLVGNNDWRARCWSAATQLQQNTKKLRCQGVIASGQLLSFVMQNPPGTVNESLLHEFGIVETLDGITGANQTVACSMLAPWACQKAIEEQDIFGNNIIRQKAWEQAQRYIKSAQCKKKDKQLKLLGQFVNAVMTHEHETASKLFGTVVNDKNIKGLPKSILAYASAQLKEFAQQGDRKAQACRAHQLLAHKDKKKQQEGGALCCDLMENLLSGEIEKKQIDVSQLSADLGTIVNTGNARSCYLLSRYKFRQLHKDCEQTGLSVDQDQNLLAVFKLAGTASKNGCKQAREFAKALMFYRGSLGFIKKKQYDAAVEQLTCLYNYQSLPEIEQTFCQAFAFDQLSKLAYQHGNAHAQCWQLEALLSSSNAEDMGQVFEVGRRLLMSAITKIDKKKLQAIKEYNLIETLKDCVDALDDGQIKAEGHCLLMQWYAVQANPQLSNDPEPFLQKALSFGKQALKLCGDEHKSSYKKKIGNIYYSLACCYKRINKSSKQLEYLRKGSALQHPGCMRVLALGALKDVEMSKEMFDAHIANLTKAHVLGDQPAGNFLVSCYVNGPKYKFPCGYAVPQDRGNALKIFHYQNVLKQFEMLKPKGPATVIPLIGLCMEHDIYPEAIMNYLQKEVEQDNADAIHALGTLCVHRSEIDEGIALFEKGWREYEHPDCAVALAHILSTPLCDQMDLDQSWECFYGGIEKRPKEELQSQEVRSGAIFYLRNLTTLIEEARKEKNKEQEQEALDVVGKLMALSKKIDFFSQSVESCITCAAYYSQSFSDHVAAIESVERAYSALGADKKPNEVQQVQATIQLICDQVTDAKDKKKLSEEGFQDFTNRLKNLFRQIVVDNLR